MSPYRGRVHGEGGLKKCHVLSEKRFRNFVSVYFSQKHIKTF